MALAVRRSNAAFWSCRYSQGVAEYDAETIDLMIRPCFEISVNLNEALKQFVERYESLADDPDAPPFRGSHYSSSPIVLFFLLRWNRTSSRSFGSDRFVADRCFTPS